MAYSAGISMVKVSLMIKYNVEVDDDGSRFWYRDFKFHREDGPAIEWSSGGVIWFVNGKRHRKDGPAVERSDGTKEWWLNGANHRIDGPAVERSDGTKEWYLSGEWLAEEQHAKRMSRV